MRLSFLALLFLFGVLLQSAAGLPPNQLPEGMIPPPGMIMLCNYCGRTLNMLVLMCFGRARPQNRGLWFQMCLECRAPHFLPLPREHLDPLPNSSPPWLFRPGEPRWPFNTPVPPPQEPLGAWFNWPEYEEVVLQVQAGTPPRPPPYHTNPHLMHEDMLRQQHEALEFYSQRTPDRLAPFAPHAGSSSGFPGLAGAPSTSTHAHPIPVNSLDPFQVPYHPAPVPAALLPAAPVGARNRCGNANCYNRQGERRIRNEGCTAEPKLCANCCRLYNRNLPCKAHKHAVPGITADEAATLASMGMFLRPDAPQPGLAQVSSSQPLVPLQPQPPSAPSSFVPFRQVAAAQAPPHTLQSLLAPHIPQVQPPAMQMGSSSTALTAARAGYGKSYARPMDNAQRGPSGSTLPDQRTSKQKSDAEKKKRAADALISVSISYWTEDDAEKLTIHSFALPSFPYFQFGDITSVLDILGILEDTRLQLWNAERQEWGLVARQATGVSYLVQGRRILLRRVGVQRMPDFARELEGFVNNPSRRHRGAGFSNHAPAHQLSAPSLPERPVTPPTRKRPQSHTSPGYGVLNSPVRSPKHKMVKQEKPASHHRPHASTSYPVARRHALPGAQLITGFLLAGSDKLSAGARALLAVRPRTSRRPPRPRAPWPLVSYQHMAEGFARFERANGDRVRTPHDYRTLFAMSFNDAHPPPSSTWYDNYALWREGAGQARDLFADRRDSTWADYRAYVQGRAPRHHGSTSPEAEPFDEDKLLEDMGLRSSSSPSPESFAFSSSESDRRTRRIKREPGTGKGKGRANAHNEPPQASNVNHLDRKGKGKAQAVIDLTGDSDREEPHQDSMRKDSLPPYDDLFSPALAEPAGITIKTEDHELLPSWVEEDQLVREIIEISSGDEDPQESHDESLSDSESSRAGSPAIPPRD